MINDENDNGSMIPITSRSQDSLLPINELPKSSERKKRPEIVPSLNFTILQQSSDSESEDIEDKNELESEISY